MQPCEDEHVIPDRKITDAIGHRGIERQPSLGTTLHTLLGSARGIDQRRLDDSDWTNLVRHALLRALGPPDALVGLISFDHGVRVDPDQGPDQGTVLFAGERSAETGSRWTKRDRQCPPRVRPPGRPTARDRGRHHRGNDADGHNAHPGHPRADIDGATRAAIAWPSALDHQYVKSSRCAVCLCPRGDLNRTHTGRGGRPASMCRDGVLWPRLGRARCGPRRAPAKSA